eukprot:TRINITY_DN499_c0_g1_i11.p1 TRINITY_DN499_c0_g1~~TRINITY_DN499_c0_g1_i11.p1  ORF type:complete len:747 (-),score=198.35 TRINITY_DN499_c0_g1_i11:294-2534(-)
MIVFMNEMLVTSQALLSCLVICSLNNTSAGLNNLPDIAPVPPILLEGTVVLAFLLILWAVIGFLCIYRENKTGMIMISFLSILTTFFLFVFCILLFLYIPYSKEELMKTCSSILPFLDDEYILKAGCVYGKYRKVSADIHALGCPKEDIKFTWEMNYLEKSPEAEYVYGCINSECCQIVIADIRLIFTFTVIMVIILCIVAIVASVSLQMSKGKFKSESRVFFSLGDLVKGGHVAIFALLVAGIVFTVVYYSQNIYKAPTNPSFLEVKSAAPKSDKLGAFHFPESGYKDGRFKLNMVIVEDHEDCEKSSDDLVYHTAMAIKTYGRFIISPYVYGYHYVNMETSEYDTSIAFSCLFKDLNPILRLIDLETPYPAKENKVAYHVKAIHDPDYKEAWSKRLLEEKGNEEGIEEGAEEGHEVLNEEVTYSLFPTRDKVVYRGRVMEKTRKEGNQPIPAVSVKIVLMDEARSEIEDAETNQSGHFEISLSLHVTFNEGKSEITPYQILMTFTKEGYETGYVGMTLGTEGLLQEKNMTDIYLQRDYTNPFALNVPGIAINALTEKPAGKVYVNLVEPVKKTVRAKKNGKFFFNSSEECKHALISVDNEGYYPLSRWVPCAGDVVIPVVPIIGEYKLRSVLYWSKALADLDLHVIFQKDNATECISDFTQAKCGGAVYRGDRNLIDNLEGVEIIDLDTIGTYQYLFYVDSFIFNETVPIGNTRARVEVYSGTLKDPVVEIYSTNLNVTLFYKR